MNNVTVTFDYTALDPALADEARAAAERIRHQLHQSVYGIGRDLIAIQERLPHGQFGAWIAAEFQMGERTAYNYMNACRFLEGKPANFANLPAAAIYALAAPSAPPAVVAEVEAEIERGAVPKIAEIRERIAGATKAQLAAAAMKSADQVKRDRENEKRRRAAQAERDRKAKEEWARNEARREAKAQQVAEFLVARIGGAGVAELLTMMRGGTDWYRVEKQFGCEGSLSGFHLTADEINAKFGGDVAA